MRFDRYFAGTTRYRDYAPVVTPPADDAPAATRLPLTKRLLRYRTTRQFGRHRDAILGRFLQEMQASGQPEGLRWLDAQPSGEPVVLPRRRRLHVTVLQPLEVRFAAVDGGGMEDAPGLATVRAAVAMFDLQNGEWLPGRCLFNVDAAAVAGRLRGEDESP